MHSSKLRIYWAAFLIVGLLSLYMNLTAVGSTVIDGMIRGDARDYLAYAFNLKMHGVYSHLFPLSMENLPTPDALRAPGYPWLISLLLNPSSADLGLTAVFYLQAILGASTTLLTMLIFQRVLPAWARITCGVLVAISPHLININVYLLTESLFTFLLLAHIYTLILAYEKKSNLLFGLSGLLLGATWLVRPTTILLALIYLVFLGLKTRKKEITWQAIASLLLPFMLVFSGWTARNYIEIGKASDPQLTINFIHHGSYINFMYKDRPETFGYPYRHDPHQINSLSDAVNLNYEHFQNEPIRYIGWVLFGKPMQFLSWDLTETIGDAFIYAPLRTPYAFNAIFIQSHHLAKWLHLPLMALAILGSFYFLLNSKHFAIQIGSIIVLYFVVFHMIGSPFPRYSIPIRPLCYGLALCALLELYPKILKNAHRDHHSLPERSARN